MPSLPVLILIGGLLHFTILIASALVPKVLDWKRELASLGRLTRQLVWVHGVFIVLVIIGFGAIAVVNAGGLAAGSPLARSVCAFVAVFWGARLSLQFVLFDPAPFAHRVILRLGHHGLTVVFTYLTLTFAWCAVHPA